MKLKNIRILNHLQEGHYTGCITKCSVTEDQRFVWLNIEIEESKEILNVSISTASKAFSDFAEYYADDTGEFDTDDFIDSMVNFNIADKEINSNIYSKITSIVPFEE